MSKRMRKDRTRIYNILGEEWRMDLNGFQFILLPSKDASAWKALEFYASVTPNETLKHALLVWLRGHPCPWEPEMEQMEMGL